MKLLKAEWGDDDAFTNATEIGPNSTAKTDPNSKITQGSPMKVERAWDAVPTLFGMNAEDFNKLTNINKLQKCWTYSTGKLYHYLPTTLCTNIYCVSHGGPNMEQGPSASLEGLASKICFHWHSGPFVPMWLSCTWAKFTHHCKRHCWHPRGPGEDPSQLIQSTWIHCCQTSHHLSDCRQRYERL